MIIKGDLKIKVEHQGYAPLSKVIRKDSIVRQISLELTPELVDSNFIIGRFIAGRYYKNEDGTETMKTSSGQAMITGRFITGRMITGGTPSFISRIKSIFKKDEGGVSAEITVGDPDKNIGSFPGDFQASDPQFAKASGSSERVQLATSGWIDITFRDAEGNPVQVVSKDNPAIVMRRIPDSQQKDVIEAYKRGVRSIPWYYYDEGEGIWKRTEFDANVILVNEDVDEDGVQEEVAYAQVPITHTSYYNLDYPLNSTEICFQGKVLDANGRPVPGLYVIAYSSSSYTYARTDDKGEFKIYVPQAKFRRCLEWRQECRWGNYFCWPSCIRYGNVLEYWRFKIFAADKVRWGEIKERTRVLEVSTEGKEKYKCHDIGVLPPPEMYSLSCSVKDVSGNPLVGASVVSSDGKPAETDSSGKFTLISKKGNLVLTVSYEKDGRIYKAQKEIYVDKDINEDVCSIVMRLEPVKIKCSAFINQNPGEIEVFVNGNNTKTNQDGSFEVSIPRPVKDEEVKLLYIAKFPDGSTEGQMQIIKVKPDDTEVLCPQNINFEYNEVCVEGQVKNEEGKGIKGVYVLVGGKSPVITDEGGFFKVQGGRAKKTEEGKYKYKVKYIYLSPYGREEVENEYEAKGTECVWDKQEIDTRPAWLIGTVKTKRGRHVGGAKVETEFGEVDYTNPGVQFKLKAPTNSKVKVYASYGGATTQVEVQTKERGSTASVDIILNVDDTPPKVRVLGLGKAKPGGKLRFKIEITDDSDSVGYGVRIKDWGFSDSGTIKLENGRGEKEFEVGVPAGAKSADLELEAKDTGGNEDRVVMKVEVVEKNRAPEIIRIDVEGEVMVGGRFIASAVGYDPDGDEMSYEWGLTKGEKDYSGWMMVYGATAVVDVPENASGGIYLMKVKVKDSEGGERIFVREINLTKELKKGESVCVPSEEICDGLDNDCNGLIDDGVKLVFYKDLDGDGYTDGTTSVGCSAPSGYVSSATSGDCNDNDQHINPGKAEICDGIDNNCNGQTDEGVKLVFYRDKDGDGYGDVNDQTLACVQPTGYVSNSSDCNDNDPNVNPGKTEICDGKDNDCDGQIDEGFNVGQSCTVGIGECARTGQYVCKADGSGTQCNATPGTPTTEICDGKDNDCDGQTDEGNVCGVVLDLGDSHTCAIKQDGSLWCWGRNLRGQVGDGTNTDRNIPVQIMSSGISSISLGSMHTCAIKQDGSLWCWGDNDYGQRGDGMVGSKNFPVQIIPSGVLSVSLGSIHTCAIKQDGSLWCWGSNSYGQLGDGTYTSRTAPVQIMSSGVKAVSLGYYHTCVIKQDSSLWCWGRDNYGNGITTPIQVIPSGVSSVSSGSYHTCAVKIDGSLWCWGDNSYGQLGNGTYSDSSTPVQIISSGVVSVSAGGHHTCAIKQDSSLWCWGDNVSGQLGNGSQSAGVSSPVQIVSSGVKAVSLGWAHTCAIKTDGSLWCWGRNDSGQLGDGTYTIKTSPTYIMNLGSGGGGAPFIFFGEKSSFDNREEIQANSEQKRIRYGCSSANIVFYVLHLFVPAFILFALLKSRFFVRN
jgi:alpha-tubulin suppressor-like RCC1 family protein